MHHPGSIRQITTFLEEISTRPVQWKHFRPFVHDIGLILNRSWYDEGRLSMRIRWVLYSQWYAMTSVSLWCAAHISGNVPSLGSWHAWLQPCDFLWQQCQYFKKITANTHNSWNLPKAASIQHEVQTYELIWITKCVKTADSHDKEPKSCKCT